MSDKKCASLSQIFLKNIAFVNIRATDNSKSIDFVWKHRASDRLNVLNCNLSREVEFNVKDIKRRSRYYISSCKCANKLNAS